MADNFLTALERERPTIEQYLPSYFDKELWMLNAKNLWKAIQGSDRLRACSLNSLVECIIEAARRGLEIGTANKHCAPVAFGKEATLLTQWQGRTFLWMKSGSIKKLKVDVAFEGDYFKYLSGDEDRVLHEPDQKTDHNMAWRNNVENIIAAYAIATLWSGERVHSVCFRPYLKRIMAFVEKQKGLTSFWRDWLPEMCIKTAVNRLDGKIQPPPNMTAEQMDAWSRAGAMPSVETEFAPIVEEAPDNLPGAINDITPQHGAQGEPGTANSPRALETLRRDVAGAGAATTFAAEAAPAAEVKIVYPPEGRVRARAGDATRKLQTPAASPPTLTLRQQSEVLAALTARDIPLDPGGPLDEWLGSFGLTDLSQLRQSDLPELMKLIEEHKP